jgi:hypothetical protein
MAHFLLILVDRFLKGTVLSQRRQGAKIERKTLGGLRGFARDIILK